MTSAIASHGSSLLPSRSFFASVPDAVVQKHLLPFLAEDAEEHPQSQKFRIIGQLFALRTFALINRRCRSLVPSKITRSLIKQNRTIFDIWVHISTYSFPSLIYNGRCLLSLRVYFHHRSAALHNGREMGNCLHAAVSPGREEHLSVSFVSYLLYLNGRDQLGLFEREDTEHMRPFERLCTQIVPREKMRALLSLFLQNGLEINKRNTQGDTPLHYVGRLFINRSSLFVLSWLLQNGADLNLPNAKGETALELYIGNAFGSAYRDYGIERRREIIEAFREGMELFFRHGARMTSPLLKYADPNWVHALEDPDCHAGNSTSRHILAIVREVCKREGQKDPHALSLRLREQMKQEGERWWTGGRIALGPQRTAEPPSLNPPRGREATSSQRVHTAENPSKPPTVPSVKPLSKTHEELRQYQSRYGKDFLKYLPVDLLFRALSDSELEIRFTWYGTALVTLADAKGEVFRVPLEKIAKTSLRVFSSFEQKRRLLSRLSALYQIQDKELKKAPLIARIFAVLRYWFCILFAKCCSDAGLTTRAKVTRYYR